MLLGLVLGCAEDGTPSEGRSGAGGNAAGAAGSGAQGGEGNGAGGSSGDVGGASGSAGSLGASGSAGSAGAGSAGASGGGSGGASGAAGDADAGDADAGNPVCEPASRAVVLATIGDFPCIELIACLEASCESELESAVGANYRAGDYSGAICEDYVNCVADCECESACGAECRSQFVSVAGPCLDAMSAVSSCRMDVCQPEADLCGY